MFANCTAPVRYLTSVISLMFIAVLARFAPKGAMWYVSNSSDGHSIDGVSTGAHRRRRRGFARSAMLALLLVLMASGRAWATTYYVSNAASNGYVVGADTNNGTSKSTPFLTWNKAAVVAATGDVVNGNPSGTSYVENTGTSGLSLTLNGVTFQTDQSLLGVGNCTITGLVGTSTRVMNIPSSPNAIVFNNITIDGQNQIDGPVPHNQTGSGVAWNGCTFQNFTGHNCIASPTGTGNVFAFTNCTVPSSVPTLLNSGGGYTSLTITGCTLSPATNVINLFSSGSTCTTLSITNNNVSNTSAGAFYVGNGTISTATVTGNTFNACWSALYSDGGHAQTITTLNFSNNTIQGASTNQAVYLLNLTCTSATISGNNCTADGGLSFIAGESASGVTVNNNTVTMGANGTGYCISGGPIGPNYLVYGNTISNAATNPVNGAACIVMGRDGYFGDSSNTAATTGNQNLYDVAGDTYVDQTITASQTVATAHASYIAGFSANILKVGSPTGSITCSLYTDNAGVPGTLVETSATSLSASLVSTSAQAFFFLFSNHSQLTPAAKYHMVFTVSGGAVSSSNYFQFQKNTTVTFGAINTSTLGPGNTWVADATHAIMYTVYTCMVGATNAVIRNNTITVTSPASVKMHGVLVGSAIGAKVDSNFVLGGTICVIPKDSFSVQVSNNLFYSTNSTEAGIYSKGSTGTLIYHNTVILNAATPGSCVQLNYDQTLGIQSPPGTCTALNNVLVQEYSGGGAFVYNLSINGAGQYPTGTFNNNVVYATSGNGIEAVRYSSWSAWQTAGFDAASVNSDPLLVNRTNPAIASDFKPTVTSPAIWLGTNLLSSVPTDYLGIAREAAPTAGALRYSASTDEFMARVSGATTTYIVLRNAAGQPYNRATRNFETYVSANLGNYAIPMTQQGGSGIWFISMNPSLAYGRYFADYRVQAGGSPAEADTFVTDTFNKSVLNWSGATELQPVLTDTSGRPQANMVQAGGSTVAPGSIPNAAAGAAGGLHINGANTGPISISGGVSITNSGGDALSLSSSGGNGNGLRVTGNGTGTGIAGNIGGSLSGDVGGKLLGGGSSTISGVGAQTNMIQWNGGAAGSLPLNFGTMVVDSNGRIQIQPGTSTGQLNTIAGNPVVGGYAANQDPATYLLATPSQKIQTSANGVLLDTTATFTVRNQDAITVPTIGDALLGGWLASFGKESESGTSYVKMLPNGTLPARTFTLTKDNTGSPTARN